ncbi:MAG TPA: RlmE family RNA methyltransferase [Candidatus Ozemobacteraceae bacterium]|nr:RlmE family RNA methyltransferase [Candidatus Ozemobacteraceae bacterium]
MAKAWFKDRLNDPWLRKARQEQFRSRAAYKLEEIHRKYKLLKPGMKILDLGAAPGSWTQMALHCLNGKGLVVAIDLLPIDPIEGAIILQGDIRAEESQKKIADAAKGKFDVILSDMAPDTTGIHHADTSNSAALVTLALDLCAKWLKPGGSFVAKVFEGSEYKDLHSEAKKKFEFLKSVNPEASLTRSREVYLVGTGFKGNAPT